MNDVNAPETLPVEEENPLVGLLRLLRRYVGLILSIWIAVQIVVYFGTITTRPEYEATTNLLVEFGSPQVVDIKRVMDQSNLWSIEYLETQIQLLQSETLARRVVTALKLEKSKEFQSDPDEFWDWYEDGYLKLKGTILSSIGRLFSSSSSAVVSSTGSVQDPEEVLEGLAAQLRSRVRAKNFRNSRILGVTFRGYYPEEVAKITNAVADQFIEWNLEREFSGTRKATKWLEGQLAELRVAVERSEQSLQNYRRSENLVATDLTDSPEIVTGALGILSKEVIAARTERIEAEVAYRQFKSYLKGDAANSKLDNIPANIFGKGTQIANLQMQLAGARRDHANLSNRYKRKHPLILQLNSKIKFLKRRLRKEVSRAFKNLETRFVVAEKRERSLMANLEKEKARMIRLGGKTVQLGILKREVEGNRKLYQLLFTRMKETALAAHLPVSLFQVVDRARVPKGPVRPKKGRNQLLGTILGLFLGFGAAFGIQFFDTSLRDPKEAERILGIPVLAAVNNLRKLRKQGSDLVVGGSEQSGWAENFDTLRTKLLYTLPANQEKIFLVTSANPQEGKTFIASNLAATLAGMGQQVALIDADLRRPRVHTLFDLEREPGLTDFLVGNSGLEDILHQTSVDDLWVIPAGHETPSPQNLLSSDRLGNLLTELQVHFKYILMDSPPVLRVADCLPIIPHVSGVLMVVWAGRSSYRHTLQALQSLREVSNDRVFYSTVMNRVPRRRSKGYYYYEYGY